MSQQAQDVMFTDFARVVVGWGGRATAVWFRPDAVAGFDSGRLFASVRGDGGDWSEPMPVSPSFSLTSAPSERFDVAAGRGGAVSVVWTASVQGVMGVFESHRDGTDWSTPFRLGTGRSPRVVMDGRGVTTVLWSHQAPRLVTRRSDGVWSAPHVFAGGVDRSHALASDRAGDEVVLWSQWPPHRGRAHMKAAFRAGTSHTWSQAVTVPSKVIDYVGPGLAVDPHGRVLAAWATTIGDRVVWTRRSLAGRWSPARRIAGDVGTIGEYGYLDLSLNRDGRGLVRWIADIGGTYVARYRPGHGFGDPVRLSTDSPPGFIAQGSPLLTADGTAVVAGVASEMGSSSGAYRWQAPGRPWSPVQALQAAQAVDAVGARGSRMVVLFQDQGLRARVIDVR